MGILRFKTCVAKLHQQYTHRINTLCVNWTMSLENLHSKCVHYNYHAISNFPQVTTLIGFHGTGNLAGHSLHEVTKTHCAPVDTQHPPPLCLLPNTGLPNRFVFSQRNRKSKPSQKNAQQLSRSSFNRSLGNLPLLPSWKSMCCSRQSTNSSNGQASGHILDLAGLLGYWLGCLR